MQVNSLSVEMLLARFFDTSLLGSYCEKRLGKSAKGSASTLAARIVSAWGKPRQRSEQSTKRRKTASSPSDDWRRTLFAWQGNLHTDEQSGTLTWKGAWVPIESPAQSLCEASRFTSSENQFELTSTSEAAGAELSCAKTWLAGPRGEWRGWYLLDQDDGAGLKRYADNEHRFGLFTVCMEALSPSEQERAVSHASVCIATGDTEFGRFVSAGRAIDASDGTVLTLCRRYVADGDPRAELRTVADVVSFLTPSALCAAAAHPWTLL